MADNWEMISAAATSFADRCRFPPASSWLDVALWLVITGEVWLLVAICGALWLEPRAAFSLEVAVHSWTHLQANLPTPEVLLIGY